MYWSRSHRKWGKGRRGYEHCGEEPNSMT
jgi:hypothetical protein